MRSSPRQSTCSLNKRDLLLKNGAWFAECEFRVATTRFPVRLRLGQVGPKVSAVEMRSRTKARKSERKGKTVNRPSLFEGKGKDIWRKDSSWRPWSSENCKGPRQRDEGDRGRGTPLRKKDDDPHGHWWDEFSTTGWSATSKEMSFESRPAPNERLFTKTRRKLLTQKGEALERSDRRQRYSSHHWRDQSNGLFQPRSLQVQTHC